MEHIEFSYIFRDKDRIHCAKHRESISSTDEHDINVNEVCSAFVEFMQACTFSEDQIKEYFKKVFDLEEKL